jgi:eukaryotic-like serine/threonine-protein kinase
MTPGTKLGPYEVIAAIGAGGMGEVYRAHDPKLGRDVAIKVLPEAFARDAERMARFQREAKVLASLSHPNIATIYGLEDSGSTRALVMELVEGPTLAERIKAGPIPIDEAVRLARQIADALEYAHERGIIHRDLKPVNVKVTNDDVVKVLDFGLAKALEGDPLSLDISTSPTISRMATQAGVLLGTAAYMSPEQAKAKPVDRRADIWAFGCVLYEMLTGKVAFPGDSVTDTLAGVIRAEPDWSQLPATTPMRVRVLLQRCLQKDPKERLQAIGDARIALNEVLSGAPDLALAGRAEASAVPLWRRAFPWGIAAVLFVALASLAFVHFSEKAPTPAEPVRFEIPVPDKMSLAANYSFALSPDGRKLVFAAAGSDGVQRLWVRALDSLDAHPLPGTESPNLVAPFFWSADSRFVAYDAGGKLKKVDTSGGSAETICNLDAVGGSWNQDGVIIFGQTPGQSGGGLMRVSAAGGSASPLTIVNRSRGELHHIMPSFLPDGRHFLYWRQGSGPGASESEGIYVGSLDAKPEEQSSKRLLATNYGPAAYVPTAAVGSGELLFVRDRTLMAQPFDTRRLQLQGEPVTLVENIASFLNTAAFQASDTGVLVYRVGGSGSLGLAWYDREGKVLSTTGKPGTVFVDVSLSPDGSRAAVGSLESNPTLWLLDFSRGTSTRFTFGSASTVSPVWSPDGSSIIFASYGEGHYDLYQKSSNGATDETPLLKSSDNKYPHSWSRDGHFLLYTVQGTGVKALWVLPLDGDKKPFPFLRTEFNEDIGRFSPDGHWVAYESDESGRMEIYVRPFSPNASGTTSVSGGKWLISTGGGTDPRWRGDGKEMYYLSPDLRLMAVEVTTSPVFQAGVPKALFQTALTLRTQASAFNQWDTSADGRRFLLTGQGGQSEEVPFTVVLNWQAALKK